jgi:hypothetical protein
MNPKLKSIFDSLIRCHSVTQAEFNSDKPNMANIENALNLQGMTLLELKDELNGSYYMTEDEKQAYYHEEEKKRLANELNQQ